MHRIFSKRRCLISVAISVFMSAMVGSFIMPADVQAQEGGGVSFSLAPPPFRFGRVTESFDQRLGDASYFNIKSGDVSVNCLYGGFYTRYASLPKEGAAWNYSVANFLIGQGGDGETTGTLIGYMPSASAGIELLDTVVQTEGADPVKGQAITAFGGAGFMYDYITISGDDFSGFAQMYILSLMAGAIGEIYADKFAVLPYVFASMPLFGEVWGEVDGETFGESIDPGKPGVAIGFDVRFMRGGGKFFSVGSMLQQMQEIQDDGDDVKTIMLTVNWNY